MNDRLAAALDAPPSAPDPSSWLAACRHAESVLARLAVRRGAAGPFRVTGHEIRTALGGGQGDANSEAPFTWTARTARRPLGLAAVRLLLDGAVRSPAEAVRHRVAESTRLLAEGDARVSRLDRWVAELSPSAAAIVGAAAVTWATRLWSAHDWSACADRPVIGRDRWWDSPHSALLALRGRADVRTGGVGLVVLSGPRRDSVRAELSLVTLVDTLRTRDRSAPGHVVGWWPDSGHVMVVEPEPAVLTEAAEAVATVVLGAAPTIRPAA